jgi:ABC-type phosphate transport system substrate-binding protein
MKKTHIYFALSCLLALCAIGVRVSAQQAGDVAVIVNPGNPIDSITSADLKKVFTGDKTSWGGGLTVAPFVRTAPAHERDMLLKVVLKMTDAQYQDFWVKKVYSGSAAHEPLGLMSNGMQLEAVRSQKGAIALVNLADVKDGVKVIKVDGIAPGAAGYSLK